jgi:glycerol-3-phosphate dehydrogenase (NAD(P)+)
MAAGRTPIAVLGAGSWGTALAIHLARNGNPTTLWGHDPAEVAPLVRERVNRHYLPDAPFPDGLQATADLAAAVATARDLLVVVPSHAFAATLARLAGMVRADTRLAWATKGLEPETGRLLSEVAGERLPGVAALAVISGPTFAREVAAGLPTAVTVAANRKAFAAALSRRLHAETFRTYTSRDLVGVQLGGAVKNVLAIACGISDGRGLGDSARAALTTRAFAELARFGRAMGARPETLTGLSGLGDLVLTCASRQSRNFAYGIALGEGASAPRGTVEGVPTAGVVSDMAQARGVDMPICTAVRRIVEGRSEIDEELGRLLARPLKPEID